MIPTYLSQSMTTFGEGKAEITKCIHFKKEQIYSESMAFESINSISDPDCTNKNIALDIS